MKTRRLVNELLTEIASLAYRDMLDVSTVPPAVRSDIYARMDGYAELQMEQVACGLYQWSINREHRQ